MVYPCREGLLRCDGTAREEGRSGCFVESHRRTAPDGRLRASSGGYGSRSGSVDPFVDGPPLSAELGSGCTIRIDRGTSQCAEKPIWGSGRHASFGIAVTAHSTSNHWSTIWQDWIQGDPAAGG